MLIILQYVRFMILDMKHDQTKQNVTKANGQLRSGQATANFPVILRSRASRVCWCCMALVTLLICSVFLDGVRFEGPCPELEDRSALLKASHNLVTMKPLATRFELSSFL